MFMQLKQIVKPLNALLIFYRVYHTGIFVNKHLLAA